MLLHEFSAATREQWLAQVTKELKGIDVQQTTRWEFEKDNFVEAMLFASEARPFEYLQLLNVADNDPNGMQGRIWYNQLVINVKDLQKANQKAKEALNNGVEAVCFQCDATTDLHELLDQILLPYCTISFELPSNGQLFLEKYHAYIQAKNYDNTSIRGFLSVATENGLIQTLYPNFQCFVIKTALSTESPSKQIADLIGQTKNIVEKYKKNFTITQILSQIQLQITIGNLYFVEMAKLRALRLLFTYLAWEQGADTYSPQDCVIAATTTLQIGKDNNYSLISNTTQAMSAVIGGANLLTITPHITDNQDFAERIARNISNLLREESYLDKVATANAGAYFIDQLTDKIAEKAWSLS